MCSSIYFEQENLQEKISLSHQRNPFCAVAAERDCCDLIGPSGPIKAQKKRSLTRAGRNTTAVPSKTLDKFTYSVRQ